MNINRKKLKKVYFSLEIYFSSLIFIFLVNCVWDEWGEWSTCSKSCDGGESSRTRAILTPSSNGGRDCTGEGTETKTCNNTACPIDCKWGPYGDWSPCSRTCGEGEKSRSRSEAVPASNGGKECLGNATEIIVCNEEVCKGN